MAGAGAFQECLFTGPVHGAWHERIIKERNVAGLRDDLASAAVHLTWTAGKLTSPSQHASEQAEASWMWFPSGMKLALPPSRKNRRAKSMPNIKEELPEGAASRTALMPKTAEISKDSRPTVRLPTGLESSKPAAARRRPVTSEKMALGDGSSECSDRHRDAAFFRQDLDGHQALRWRPASSLSKRKPPRAQGPKREPGRQAVDIFEPPATTLLLRPRTEPGPIKLNL
mmetsp:Transcript_15466/g.27120  ORF Transcript_15466/g.27120 Transcript_15466/m.27120 type:complete len:228 (+) Transcript_15466:53-736(+)|eukprot:CAMPEP_0197642414 /NCGR_PEP_ID=MMETSP1338-20131121/16077_1 /TAXON_ID=43686 ORGANISM="Pelagodinium beii, Strain RCC1491" /NCGR_SAMPLE_ID=MMETSP1338 /ASSEMBLY_ACC=CAM_ASM_000754 /LENGTH=227 /DNA_ID=CAMNT_0043215527 /DNA_START=42 /DNA_END=725 /DNA_ORIENTATION=-